MKRLVAQLHIVIGRLLGCPRLVVPERLRDSFDVLRYQRLRDQIPFLYLTLFIITIAAGYASSVEYSLIYQYALPGMMLALCAGRLLTWYRMRDADIDAPSARRVMARSTVFAIALVAFGAVWTVLAFVEADTARRALAPMFLLLCCFACANSFASLPAAAIAALFIGMAPISVVMMASGDPGMIAIAVSILLISLLQSRMVVGRYVEIARNLILQSELEDQANSDSLTGLFNRRAFTRRIDEAIAGGPSAARFALVMIDLDGFKPVNDQHGHGTGDALLCAVSDRLRACSEDGDFIARIGGDEFAIILPRLPDAEGLANWASWLCREISRPYAIVGSGIRISASIGTAYFPDDSRRASELLSIADHGLYRAKAATRLSEKPLPRRVQKVA